MTLTERTILLSQAPEVFTEIFWAKRVKLGAKSKIKTVKYLPCGPVITCSVKAGSTANLNNKPKRLIRLINKPNQANQRGFSYFAINMC